MHKTLLEEHLSRVEAPPELWNRVRNPRQAQPRRTGGWVLAAALPMAAVVLVHVQQKPAQTPASSHFSAVCMACHTSGGYNNEWRVFPRSNP